MEQVRRWDTGAVGSVERTDQGYLRCDATITKTGVFAYQLPNGQVRRELRLPEEVFDGMAIRSFGLSPLTNGHPPVLLNATNTGRYQVGSVVEPRRDGDHVAAYVQITDADTIDAAEGGRRQLSCGYTCSLEQKTGVTRGIEGVSDGLHFDAIQRGIRGNHVALVDKGRAGADVQLRIDCQDGFQIETDEQRYDQDPSTIQTLIFAKSKFTADEAIKWAKEHGFSSPKGADESGESIRVRERDPGKFQEGSFRTIELKSGIKAVIGRPKKTDGIDNKTGADRSISGATGMESKITVDGVDYECTPQVEQAVAKLTARIDELGQVQSEAETKLSEQRARADAAEESLAAEKQAREDAVSPEKIREAVNARLSLERTAAPILGDEAKLDEMSDDDIKRAVVVAAAKDKDLAKERLDGCEAVYLQARFDAALESWVKEDVPNAGLAATRQAANQTVHADGVDAARARMIAHNQEIGRKPLN